MTIRLRPITLSLSTTGDRLALFRRSLEEILSQILPDDLELRIGFNQSPHSLAHAIGRLGRSGESPRHAKLPSGGERFSWLAPEGFPVHAWSSSCLVPSPALLRWMWHDIPLTSEYVVWLEDDVVVEEGWRQQLAPLLEQRLDFIGQPEWQEYTADQVSRLQSQPWYRGIAVARRNNRPGAWYMSGGLLALRVACLREADFPAASFRPAKLGAPADNLKFQLGEIAHQLGWTVLALPEGIVRQRAGEDGPSNQP